MLITNTTFYEKQTHTHKLNITGEEAIQVNINKAFVIYRDDLKTTHEEAGNILAQQMMIAATENQKGFDIILDDKDI